MAEVVTSDVEIPFDKSMVPGYLARPDDDAIHPGVVVIQEYWGLVPHIEDVARRFASQGFFALAPDLYHGRAATEPDEARKLAMELHHGQAVREILAAASNLDSLSTVQPKKVGVVGWCMGGGLALAAAAHDASGLIGAAVAFYGRPLAGEDVHRITAPVLGLYAEQDHGIPVSAVHEFEQALADAGIEHHIEIYPGASHAFFNDTRPVYAPEAAQNAWKRTIDWFRQYIA